MKRIIAGVVVTASLFAAALTFTASGRREASAIPLRARSHRATAADLAKLGLPSWTENNAFIDDPPKTVKWSTHYKANWQDSLALALAVFGGAAGVFS